MEEEHQRSGGESLCMGEGLALSINQLLSIVMSRRLLLLAFVPVFLFLFGCEGEFSYTAAPMEAWVVDAETGKPIEGAVVVANWQLVVGGFDGPHDRGQLEVMETVTDSKGWFHFDGFTKRNPMLYELREDDPRIVIFKPGYQCKVIYNHYPKQGMETPFPGSYRTSDINGEIIKLAKLKTYFIGSTEFYYSSLDIKLEKLIKDCQWKKISRMILAMDQEKKRITALNPNARIRLISIDDIPKNNPLHCESPVVFFKEYSK